MIGPNLDTLEAADKASLKAVIFYDLDSVWRNMAWSLTASNPI